MSAQAGLVLALVLARAPEPSDLGRLTYGQRGTVKPTVRTER